MEILETGSQRMVAIPLETKLLQSNIIMITEALDEVTVTNYQQQLTYLLNNTREGDTIEIWINSPGGSVYDGLGFLDLMFYVKTKNRNIKTVNIGKACSFATLLLMCGTKGMRETFPHASTMVHEISSYEWGKIQDLKDATQECERLQNIINNIIKENSSEELIELCSRKDLWLSAKDAVKYNIVDTIKF